MNPLDVAIRRSDWVLGWYFRFIHLNERYRVTPVSFMVWLGALPLLLFGVFCWITHAEHRFNLGSLDWLDRNIPGFLIGGLSFLGDTMVWPFFVLVPLLLVLLRGAIGKAVRLHTESARLVRPDVAVHNATQTLTGELEARLRYQSYAAQACYMGAIVIGVLFFLYNTAACVRPNAWPNWFIPYDLVPGWLQPFASNKAVLKPDILTAILKDPAPLVIPCSGDESKACLPPGLSKLMISQDGRRLSWSGAMSLDERQELEALWASTEWRQTVRLMSDLRLRGYVSDTIFRPVVKWDTDFLGAPRSWSATRVWALLIGYAILPLAVLRVFNLLLAVRHFAVGLATQHLLLANPFSASSRNSIELITQALFSANYCLLVVSLMIAMSFLKIGARPEWHDLALLALIPIFAFAALAPLLTISDAFEKTVKGDYLPPHVTAVNAMHRDLRDTTPTMTDVVRGERAEALTKYDDYVTRGVQTTIFPVSASTIARQLAPVAPLMLTLIEKIASSFSFF